jgi:hypothetical protein
MSAGIELRRLFPGITDGARARELAREGPPLGERPVRIDDQAWPCRIRPRGWFCPLCPRPFLHGPKSRRHHRRKLQLEEQ